ncbi:hypothetical protein ACH5RR_008052 [Cinchona calisaya]|uniref:Uncharacterized protein n=1 Tax=Cinchona calisaya TaxID=153742 RepID=A0ABD3ADX8_9GENT
MRVLTFREEDIINEHDIDLSKIPQNTWNVMVISWPCLVHYDKMLQQFKYSSCQSRLEYETKIFLRRIASFLFFDHLLPDVLEELTRDSSNIAIEIADANFTWDAGKQDVAVHKVGNVEVKRDLDFDSKKEIKK